MDTVSEQVVHIPNRIRIVEEVEDHEYIGLNVTKDGRGRVWLQSKEQTVILPESLALVEKSDLHEANAKLDAMNSFDGVVALLKAIVEHAYPPDIFMGDGPSPDLGVMVASVAHMYCDEYKLRIDTQQKNWELRKEIARMKGELWAQPREEAT